MIKNMGTSQGFRRYGVSGPGQLGVTIEYVEVQGWVTGTANVVGNPVYIQMPQILAALSQTSDGDAVFTEGWNRTGPGGTAAPAHTGIVGIVKEILETSTSPGAGVAAQRCRIQIQGICEDALVDSATTANDPLTFSTTGELDVAAAENSVVAYALAADVSNVAPVLLLGAFRGIMGAFS